MGAVRSGGSPSSASLPTMSFLVAPTAPSNSSASFWATPFFFQGLRQVSAAALNSSSVIFMPV